MKRKQDGVRKLAVYQVKNGAIELRDDAQRETVWATQAQIAKIFNVERSVITKHIRNLFKISEIDKKSNVQKMHIANSDKPVIFYSLDVILAVGYRTNSARAIEFRKWATKVLKQHITKGYTINHAVIKNNYQNFLDAVAKIKQLVPNTKNIDNDIVLDLVITFASTWLSLEAYDKEKLATSGLTKKSVNLTASQTTKALAKFKTELLKKGEATDLFGQERERDSLAGIIGNVMQSFAGSDLYKTVEEKAVHLLYFIIKNHPFADGNKRSGAFVFVWFLKKTGLLEQSKITPSTLTAITLLIAESDPKNKTKIIALVLQLLR